MGGHAELEEGTELRLDWSKLAKVGAAGCDVVPVAVQDDRTGEVLILAYANQRALDESVSRGVCCLWSTSRNELWVKGASSGDVLDLVSIWVNCEQNSLLYKVIPRRKGACHTKDGAGASRVSCYYRRVIDGKLRHQRPAGDRLAVLLGAVGTVTALAWCGRWLMRSIR